MHIIIMLLLISFISKLHIYCFQLLLFSVTFLHHLFHAWLTSSLHSFPTVLFNSNPCLYCWHNFNYTIQLSKYRLYYMLWYVCGVVVVMKWKMWCKRNAKWSKNVHLVFLCSMYIVNVNLVPYTHDVTLHLLLLTIVVHLIINDFNWHIFFTFFREYYDMT